MINIKSKTTHGKKVNVKEFVNVDGEQKKKKNGWFYDDCVSHWSGLSIILDTDQKPINTEEDQM